MLLNGPLTLVAAGPGAGKTVLLSTWSSASKLPAAWVSLDPRDDEPKRFWSLVGDAFLTAGIVGETEGFRVLSHSEADAPRFLSQLLELLPGPSPHVLVIDDAHHLSDPVVLAELDAVVRYGFPQLRLILSSRSDPLLPLHRYRLAGQMHELRASDLAMTKVETHALMRSHGVRLPARELAILQQRTEGWTAGLRLSAMSMSQSRHPAQFVTRLALDQGSIGEYLVEEVLDRQPDDVRRLLIQSSFLNEVTGSLATAVTRVADASSLLAELSRTNSFVRRLDDDGDLYRFHQLLREILQHLLKRQYPTEIADLRRRAIAWYREHNEPAAAMRFAAEAGDWWQVCEVLLDGGLAQAFVERRNVLDLGLRELLAVNPDQYPAQKQAQLRVAQAAVAAFAGDFCRSAAELGAARSQELDASALDTSSLVEVIAGQRGSNIRELGRAAGALLEAPEPDSRRTAGLKAAILIAQASTHYWTDRSSAEAERLAHDGLADARRSGAPRLELEALGLLQLIHVMAGRSAHAKACQDESRDLTRVHPHLQRMTTHHLARAYGALLRADLTAAARALGRADQTRSFDADASLEAAVVFMRAWVLMASGAIAEAHHLLQNAPELTRQLPVRLTRLSTLLLADVETRLGRPNTALKAIGDNPAEARDSVQALLAARAGLDLGDAEAAEKALRPALVTSENLVSLPILVSALLASAQIAQLRGDDARAVAEIARAADLASNTIVQPFVVAEPLLQGVLSRHAEARAVWPDTANLSVVSLPAQRSGRDFPQLAQSLTERETAVLRRLATTMTTSEMADELCVSINTVKTHIAAIYRKLPAAGRRDAVVRARKLELL